MCAASRESVVYDDESDSPSQRPRSGASPRWDSPWLARAEEIHQGERTVSLTNPVDRFWRISRQSLVVRQVKSPV